MRGETGWCVIYMKKINKNGVVIKTHPSLCEILYFIFMPKLCIPHLSVQGNEFHRGDLKEMFMTVSTGDVTEMSSGL